MKKNIIAILLIVVVIAFAVISFIILPDEVVIQISLGSSENRTAPKLLAILIPFAIGLIGAISCFFTKDTEDGKEGSNWKGMIIALVGIAVFIITIVVNSL